MASLYSIDSSIQAIIDKIYSSELFEDGEITDADFSELEQLQTERTSKLENIALYVKNCEAEATAIQNEINTLKKRQERLERKCEGLRGLLVNSLTATGDKKFETARCVVKIRVSEATEILNADLIPKEYMSIKIPEPEIKPDKTAIKKAIKSGIEVAGATVITKSKAVIE